MRCRIHRLAFSLAFALTLLGQASTAPAPRVPATEVFYRRQANGNPLTQTVVTQTVQTTQTDAGLVTETCEVTLTPVNGPNGEPLVQVVRQCTVTAGPPPALASSSIPASTTTPATSATSSSLSSGAPVFSSVPISLVAPTSSSTPTSTSSINPGVSVVGLSTIPLPTVTPSPQNSPSTIAPRSTSSAVGTSTLPGADNASASPSSTAESAFQIPGKKISVLPIGLGIFAGISVIALIVVGLVTYERTKYRKIFRQRKLAEQGAGVGYS
ncbi:hypothetical protein F5148DRAFT_749296 [Russula earlei]|uniref:Uncharacterized protein n=1 Tax=Russula earlei TaxID=71964 RepID=A0ACC0UDS6_9AGAM|nr:hypothetical protein F5148DRAFT_749296 [Russula earlei]